MNAMDDIEVTPTCDLCDRPPDCGDPGCTVCPGDWNGETGCHRSCEGEGLMVRVSLAQGD